MAERQRTEEGVLIVPSGRHYSDPGEALVRWWAGKLVPTCTESIYRNWSSGPCQRAPRHDPDANGRMTKCAIHCQATKDKRAAKAVEREAAWRLKFKRDVAIRKSTADLEPALRKIADGHNDARGLAQEIIAALDAARSMK